MLANPGQSTIRKSMPSGHDPMGWAPVFPRDKREAFARRSCSKQKIERDDDSKKRHPALAGVSATAELTLDDLFGQLNQHRFGSQIRQILKSPHQAQSEHGLQRTRTLRR